MDVTDNALKNAVNLVMYAKRAAVVAIRFISSSLQAHCHRLPDTRSLQIEFTVRMGTRDKYANGEKRIRSEVIVCSSHRSMENKEEDRTAIYLHMQDTNGNF